MDHVYQEENAIILEETQDGQGEWGSLENINVFGAENIILSGRRNFGRRSKPMNKEIAYCKHAHKMLDRAESLTCDDCLFEIMADQYEKGLKDAQTKKPRVTVPKETKEEMLSLIDGQIHMSEETRNGLLGSSAWNVCNRALKIWQAIRKIVEEWDESGATNTFINANTNDADVLVAPVTIKEHDKKPTRQMFRKRGGRE